MASPNYYAILIGINRYPEKPLKGCVADVQMIQQYLESAASGSTPITIQSFQTDMVSEEHGSEPCDAPETPLILRTREHSPRSAEVDARPQPTTGSQSATHSNVLAGIERVVQEASRGDFVYVHYSGHGTTIKFPPSNLANKASGDLALVLYDPDSQAKNKLLRGRVLAGYLQRMAEKGLHVTLVLDCCFSGSVVRSGSFAGAPSRVLPYDPSTDENDEDYPPQFDTEEEISYDTYRGLSIFPRWLVEPNGYTILTACGPQEVAKEITINGTQRHGALSYFMMQALMALRNRSHRSLYHQIRAQFFEHWPQQNPSRFGNGSGTFFANSALERTSTFVPVFKHNNNTDLCLGVGLAHGVCPGDEYAIYRPGASEERSNLSAEAYVTMRVTKTGAVTSTLLEEPLNQNISRVDTGWKGKALTSFQTQTILVAIPEEVCDHRTWAEMMSQTRFCRAHSGQDTAMEQPTILVTKSECSELEIRDGSCKIMESVPRVPQQTAYTLDCVAHLVDHIATYQSILRIRNRNSATSLLSTFEITVLDEDGNDLCPDFVELKQGARVTLRIRNITERSLYVGICYLDPLWEVKNLVTDDGGGECITILPNSEESIGILGEVPDRLLSRKQTYCDDTMKVFVTTMPTSFEPLEMGQLPETIDSLESVPTRGSHTALSQLLSTLSTPRRGPSYEILDEFWTCRDIIIRTYHTQVPST
jgi:hypothetical protein